MKIQSSNMNLNAHSIDREKTSYSKTKLRLQQMPKANEDFNKALKKQFREQLNNLKSEAKAMERTSEPEGMMFELSEEDYQKIRFLELMLSELTGKEVKFTIAEEYRVNKAKYDKHVHKIVNPPSNPVIEIEQEKYTFEKYSSLSFEAKGSVKTEDGREIDFSFNLEHSRYIKEHRETTTIKGPLVDPLVINFDGRLPALTDKKYSFDLDNDGTKDQISFLTKGSGFLALDKNKDGIINNGNELFGTKSGSGFKDLAVYDLDDNGWIDENDEIFDGLRIWSKDEQGNDHLVALGEKGIGAIFLGSVASHFELLGKEYEQNGVIRESGIYLNEDGTPGSLHHVDIKL